MSPNGRILTTHVGSLPRPQDVVDQVFKVDNGEAVDPAEYDRIIGGAVADRVRHQADAGVDLVSDGEMSKIGYATYIRHRLSGFELGDVPRATPADLDAYPSFRDRLAKAGATAKYKRPICRGPTTSWSRSSRSTTARPSTPPSTTASSEAPSPTASATRPTRASTSSATAR